MNRWGVMPTKPAQSQAAGMRGSSSWKRRIIERKKVHIQTHSTASARRISASTSCSMPFGFTSTQSRRRPRVASNTSLSVGTGSGGKLRSCQPTMGAELVELSEGEGADGAVAVGRAVDRGVVHDHGDAIGREIDIDLDGVHRQLQRRPHGGEGVLGGLQGAPAVGDDERPGQGVVRHFASQYSIGGWRAHW